MARRYCWQRPRRDHHHSNVSSDIHMNNCVKSTSADILKAHQASSSKPDDIVFGTHYSLITCIHMNNCIKSTSADILKAHASSSKPDDIGLEILCEIPIGENIKTDSTLIVRRSQ
ncbi:Octopamine receptor beta-1R-like protein, partial [Operophtera brumata]